MKPWPKALQDRYPPPPAPFAERPWWTTTARRRRDYVPLVPDTLTDEGWLAAMAEYDALAPLPHPGFRAGQVWGDEHGNAVVLLSVDCHGRLRAIVDATDRARWPKEALRPRYTKEAKCPRCEGTTLPVESWSHCTACGGVGFISKEPVTAVQPVLSELSPALYPYLIADPCCPWLAPWSPLQ